MNLKDIKGIGPKTFNLLNKIGINNINDLIEYYPYRYNFYHVINLENSNELEECTIEGLVESVPRVRYVKRNFNILEFRCLANKNIINVKIFNRAFIKNNVVVGKKVLLVGKYNRSTNTFIASNIKLNLNNKNMLEPVYHLINGLNNSNIIKIVNECLNVDFDLIDYVPKYISKEYDFIDKKEAIEIIHNPKDFNELKKAKLRLIYEELFVFMLKMNYLKKSRQEELGIKKIFDKKLIDKFISDLSFSLTIDQLSSINEILEDLSSDKRMNRILVGDVGSGKTIVSMIAMYANYLGGYKSAFLAPTEILSIQHYNSMKNIFDKYNIKVELITGSISKKNKDSIKEKLLNGEIDILIGTHALLTDNVIFKDLGLVITDEQHRFGVKARDSLFNKGNKPDVLYMSATPIPRTYALTLYGDMDISTIKTKPSGRKEIKTYIKKYSELKDILYEVANTIKSNNQVYVVSPLIESEDTDLNTVVELKNKFDIAFNGKIKIDILHSKLKSNEKENIMDDFKNNNTKILISTTVIEVGVDVENATMMIIFDADKFGLSTLHQLRGRIGRNELESSCYLISDKDSERLKVLEQTNDGFIISEKDFEMRKEGDLFGIKQSGDMVFKLSDTKRDFKILKQAGIDSNKLLENKLDEKYQDLIDRKFS